MSASRILVVDDDDDIRGLVRALLERTGAPAYVSSTPARPIS
jgi:CheY-like chemotaxis protein